jgi:hypothetical protein
MLISTSAIQTYEIVAAATPLCEVLEFCIMLDCAFISDVLILNMLCINN